MENTILNFIELVKNNIDSIKENNNTIILPIDYTTKEAYQEARKLIEYTFSIETEFGYEMFPMINTSRYTEGVLNLKLNECFLKYIICDIEK